ncbi:aspartate kinase [Eubacterium xylanophilum]|uniref:aspartate kinase n=1 Tax=Eubacterium xylanophilum TaxID=39497 RepID=UPI000479F900|nr:aspartate kinase [Eubacterium xylanophilum]
MLIVKKFGGTSVADKERIFNVAKRCIEDYKKGNDVVVVLSAMGKQTDVLLDMAKDINPNAPKRELDMLLTTGEQTSVALMAMAMHSLGVPAVSLNAFQVAMHTSAVAGNARLKKIDKERITHELEQKKIVIVTGFQGVSKYDDYTTLGRGGSDTTAVALAATLHADACEIYTDVDGVYTADPRIVPDAKKLNEITYDEMLELASLGAGVLHNRSVEMAKKYGVQLVVRSSLNTSEGTIVKEDAKMEKMLVSGVASDKNVARIAVIGLEDKPGVAFKLFRHLANHNVNVDMILQSIGRDNTKDISFTVTEDMADVAVETVENHRDGSLKCKEVKVNKNVAKVSVVGAGMQSNPGVAAQMFEALFDANVNIQQISTSEIRVTVLIARDDTDKAMKAVHKEFDF